MSEIKGKNIWITGASSGIGEALAYKCAKLGAQLILSSRRKKKLEKVADKCQTTCLVIPLDLEKKETISKAIEEVEKKMGKIDILINNGGISQRSQASKTDVDVDRKLMEVNYFGTVALTKAVLPIMQKQQNGHFVTISSLSGKFGFFLRSAYAASKFAQVGFFESLRLEEEKNNIRVSIVYPGFVKTNISLNALSGDGSAHGELDNNQKGGISAEKCAQDIINGIIDEKLEIYTGGKEIWIIKLQRYFPRLFYKILRKQKGT